MKQKSRSTSTRVTTIVFAVFSAILITIFSTETRAQSVTFAQMFQVTASQDFQFTNQTSSGEFKTKPGGTDVFFRYSNISGLDPSLQGFQDGVLTITSTTSTASQLTGSTLKQPIDSTVTVTITRTTPAPVGAGSRTNLLTAVFTTFTENPGVTGNNGGNSATLSSTTPTQTVTFTSDFIVFNNTTDRNLGLSFSSVNPPLSQGANNFLASFTAAGTGTFASNPAPTVYFPPTAAPVLISGKVVDQLGFGIPRAIVEMVGEDGSSRYAMTNSFGMFNFAEVDSGTFYVFGARAKGYRFNSELRHVNDNVTDLIISANSPEK